MRADKTIHRILFCMVVVICCYSCSMTPAVPPEGERSYSGIYPHLAYYNDEKECGTGAVVPWQNDLWVITYGPHEPFGSSDKLYQISPRLKQTVRSESTGGTPASRMIHKESNQLFIGPYVIDKDKNVRVIPYTEAAGRYTGAARHLTEPESKLYIATMETGLYEVDVNTVGTKTIYEDGNVIGQRSKGSSPLYSELLPGCHGKGLYSGQGVLVYSNNGEDSSEATAKVRLQSGCLAEWDGKEWRVIRRNQFTEVTGPGGIYGNPNPETDPIWAVGWDYKSVILGTRDGGRWSFYRLPKASFSYDGAHGWNTEWPRIRDVGTDGSPDYLMTMHGMFWRFPGTFNSKNSAGIRPRSAYLKVIGDFARWDDRLVLGCDDSAQREFLNTRKVKGTEGAGQSNSNIWFTTPETPDNLGPTTATGSVWLDEEVKANEYSEPYLFAGWDHKCAWIKNQGERDVVYTFETDRNGDSRWQTFKTLGVAAGASVFMPFEGGEQGEWIRVRTNRSTRTSLLFVYAPGDNRPANSDPVFDGLARIDEEGFFGGILYGLGDNRRAMGLLANTSGNETGYYEIDGDMNIVPKDDIRTASFIREKFAIPRNAVVIDGSSVLIIDDKGRRWRLPINKHGYKEPTLNGELRLCREVVTERDLFNCYGTFYELPAENADGFAKIRPVASHDLKINDYASYRGLLIITGIDPDNGTDNRHIIKSADGKVAVWAGAIDDLWRLGRATGMGGPWLDTPVSAGEVSDPYLIGFYGRKTLTMSHDSARQRVFRIEVDPSGDGTWMDYGTFSVEPKKKSIHRFPEAFQARWVRFSVDAAATVTTWLNYE